MTDEKLTETVEQARDRLMPQVLAYARMEGLSEVGIASAALRIGITDARAVFEKAHAPTDDDEREALDADVTRPRDNEWQRLWNELVSFAAVYRRERGYSPNEAARADFLTAAGFRRSEVPEPQGEHFHIWSELPCNPGECRMEPQGEPFSDHSERYVPKRPKEPQGEPSDAQVGAAMHAVERYYVSQGFTSVADSVDYQAMRAALRAAGGYA